MKDKINISSSNGYLPTPKKQADTKGNIKIENDWKIVRHNKVKFEWSLGNRLSFQNNVLSAMALL